MAIQKTFTTASGSTGNYWKQNQYNQNADREDSVVTLQLYISQAGREEGNTPLNESVQFVFLPTDHPISEFDVDTLDLTDVEDFTDLEKHVRYQHIMNISAIANDKQVVIDASETPDNEPQLSSNETKALYFFGGIHV